MLTVLNREQQRELQHRYKQSDLYRQWLPILAMLNRDYQELDVVSMWYQAERQIVRLRGELSYREQEVPLIFNELLTDCRHIQSKGNKEETRDEKQARRTATTIMCVVLTMLMNSVEKGHEDEDFDNEPMCMAIFDILSQDTYFQQLMQLFFARKTGFDGKKVVIEPNDPMKEDAHLEGMDETALQNIETTSQKVFERTNGLAAIFDKGHWDIWEAVWRDICRNTELLVLLQTTDSPRGSEWEVNEKMVANVIGIFLEQMGYKNKAATANGAVFAKNRRDYIANHGYKCGSSTVFQTKELHDSIENIIKQHTDG